MTQRPIALIGFPRSGKSTLAPLLAEALGWPWLDTDHLLTLELGMPPADYIEQQGEAAFRQAEYTWLADWQPTEPSVLSTGGGLPCAPERWQWLRQKSLTLWLAVNERRLLHRLWQFPAHELTQRYNPLELAALYQQRQIFYAQAERIVKLGDEPPEVSLQRLLAQLQHSY